MQSKFAKFSQKLTQVVKKVSIKKTHERLGDDENKSCTLKGANLNERAVSYLYYERLD